MPSSVSWGLSRTFSSGMLKPTRNTALSDNTSSFLYEIIGMHTSALAVTAGVLAAYGIGYQLGKHNVLNRSYLQELEQHRVFGYAKADDTVLPNIQLINYPRFKIIYSTVSSFSCST